MSGIEEAAVNRHACAACKHQRKRCHADCVLAPHFPANKMGEFQQVLKVFGLSNVVKMLKELDFAQQVDAVRSLIWEASMWRKNPRYGPYGELRNLELELNKLKEERNGPLPLPQPVATATFQLPPTIEDVRSGWGEIGTYGEHILPVEDKIVNLQGQQRGVHVVPISYAHAHVSNEAYNWGYQYPYAQQAHGGVGNVAPAAIRNMEISRPDFWPVVPRIGPGGEAGSRHASIDYNDGCVFKGPCERVVGAESAENSNGQHVGGVHPFMVVQREDGEEVDLPEFYPPHGSSNF